jgi:hypothetical protein
MNGTAKLISNLYKRQFINVADVTNTGKYLISNIKGRIKLL